MSKKEIFKVIQSKFSINTEQNCKNKLTNREVLQWGENLRVYGVFSVKSKNNDLYEDLYDSVPVAYPDNTKDVVREALQHLNIPNTVDSDNNVLIILYQGGYIINGCDERIGAQLNQRIFSHYSDYMIFYITIITSKVAKELYPNIKFEVIFDKFGKPEKLNKTNCYYILKNDSSENEKDICNVEKNNKEQSSSNKKENTDKKVTRNYNRFLYCEDINRVREIVDNIFKIAINKGSNMFYEFDDNNIKWNTDLMSMHQLVIVEGLLTHRLIKGLLDGIYSNNSKELLKVFPDTVDFLQNVIFIGGLKDEIEYNDVLEEVGKTLNISINNNPNIEVFREPKNVDNPNISYLVMVIKDVSDSDKSNLKKALENLKRSLKYKKLRRDIKVTKELNFEKVIKSENEPQKIASNVNIEPDSHLQSLGYNLYDNEEQALNELKNNVITKIDTYFCDVVPLYSKRFNAFLQINSLDKICTNYNSKSVVVFLRMLMEIYEDTLPQLYNSINFKLLEYAERKISFIELINLTYSIQEKLTISDKLYNAIMDYIIYILRHDESNRSRSMEDEIMDIIRGNKNE